MAIIQTHLIGIAVLAVIFVNMIVSRTRRHFISLIFYFLIGYNFLVLVFDAIIVSTNGIETPAARALHPLFTFLYFFIHTVIISVWLYYVDYHIFQDTKRFKYLFMIAAPINIINLIFSALSLSGNFYFFIDQNNVYHRGDYFYLAPILSYGLLIATILYMCTLRHRMKRSDFYAFLIFPIPPMIAALLQIMSVGITLIWPFMAISVLAVYISVQSKITSMDALTGVSNRREYEYLVENRSRYQNKQVAGIMIDVNNLKMINDKYMHHAGDMALIKLAEILKKSIRKDDFVARIGGDEFIIIFDINDNQTIAQIVKRIRDLIDEFNEERTYPFQLSISLGYGVYQPKKYHEFKDFIKELDQKMYEEKFNNRS